MSSTTSLIYSRARANGVSVIEWRRKVHMAYIRQLCITERYAWVDYLLEQRALVR